MGNFSNNHGALDVQALEAPQQKGQSFAIPITILILCIIPDIPYLAFLKLPVAIFLTFLTLTAVLDVFKIQVPCRKVFLALIIITVLNFFNCIAYQAPLLRWMRMAFCPYIFGAMFFYVISRIDSPNSRDHLWKLLVIFVFLASFLDYITVVRLGLAETFEMRATGGAFFSATALMLIMPIFGTELVRKKWLLFVIFGNMLLLFLGGSRGKFLIIIMSIFYVLLFIKKRFSTKLLFSLFIIFCGVFIVITPIYDRIANRFESIAHGDVSFWARVDETISSVTFVKKNLVTLVFGKGYGIPWKPEYKLSLGRQPELPHGYMSDAPHSDYGATVLYTGLIGLFFQILLYFVIGLNCVAALRRSRGYIDDYTKVRLHGALLVLISRIMVGFPGAVTLAFDNNVYSAFIIAMAMADAQEIFKGKGRQLPG